jgi:hypothetical protein
VPGGGSISGNDIIGDVFHYPHRQSKWQNWAIVIGWSAFFHLCHLLMMWVTNRSFGKAQIGKGGGVGGAAGGSGSGDNAGGVDGGADATPADFAAKQEIVKNPVDSTQNVVITQV